MKPAKYAVWFEPNGKEPWVKQGITGDGETFDTPDIAEELAARLNETLGNASGVWYAIQITFLPGKE